MNYQNTGRIETRNDFLGLRRGTKVYVQHPFIESNAFEAVVTGEPYPTIVPLIGIEAVGDRIKGNIYYVHGGSGGLLFKCTSHDNSDDNNPQFRGITAIYLTNRDSK